MLKHAIIFLCMLLFVATAGAQTAGVQVSAQVERTTTTVGEPVVFQILVEGTHDAPDIRLPAITGAQVAGGGASKNSSVTIINGRRSDRMFITYQWSITPTQPGEIVIPVFEVEVAGQKFSTQEVRIRVDPVATSDSIRIRATIDADKAYVGQLIKLRVTFYNSRITVGPPTIDMPGIDPNFDVYNNDIPNIPTNATVDFLGSPSLLRETRTTIDGVGYSAFTFERTIVPRKAGTFTLGPATVIAAVADRSSRSPWDAPRYRRVTATSDPITITVNELPKEGRPSNFSGLVGSYEIEAAATPTDVGVGDPITMQVTVRGPEPLDMVPDPVTDRTPGLAGSFRVTSEATPARRSGSRLIFPRTIRTLTDKVTAIPPIELNFFDVEKGEYRVVRTDPIPLKVRPTRTITAADAIGSSDPLSNGEQVESRSGGLVANRVSASALVDRSFSLGSQLRSPAVLASVAIPPAGYAIASLLMLSKRRSANTPARRRKLAMPAALATLERTDLDPAARASTAIRQYLADTRGLPRGQALTPDETHQLLAQHSPELGGRVRELLARCDAARFAHSGDDASQLVEDARQLLRELIKGGGA